MGERYPNDSQLEAMFADYQRLKEENAALRRLLVENGITIPTQQRSGLPPLPKPDAQAMPDVHDAGVDEHSSKDAKIALFRSLFRGREDVYAFRMRFKSGEWGYVPDLIRDWKAVLSADAALRKKVDQKTRKLLPLTDDVLRRHLEGKQTILCFPTKPAGCWPSILTRRAGRMMLRHSWKHAVTSAYRQRWNDRVQATAAMSGSFSSEPSQLQRRENSGV